MSFPCIPEAGFFDSPEFLSFALHFTTSISTPIHILGLYFLLFKTPDYMKTVRWYMVNLHTWIILFDYSVGILTVPIVLLPSFAGYSFGVLTKFKVPNLYQALLVLNCLGYVQISIMAIFENRFHTICDYIGKEYWTWLRYPWLATHYFGVFGVLLSFGYMTPDQSFAIETVLKACSSAIQFCNNPFLEAFQRLPCLLRDLYEAPILVIAEDYTYHVIVCMSFIAFYCTEGFIFTGSIIYHSIKQLKTKRMSRRTFQMQKNTFIALIIQMKVPLIMIIVPSLYGWISLLTNYHNQALMNIAVTIGSFHGAFSTVVMIFVHRPYREAITSIFVKQSGRVNVTEFQQRKDIFVVINY
ncbi:hypothetical protein CRE_09302 [Caenorhabditis remanei]|uniref:Serpentine Receptor, class H n=1 Tax=Caenorhabditis remanei TaxID=31234 RepID=E3LI26_CAERE|nr:hypothetical protein CRE_09302 [Caenorhabditis remanei]